MLDSSLRDVKRPFAQNDKEARLTKLLAQITNPIIGKYGEYEVVRGNPLAPYFANVWKAFVLFGALFTLFYLIWGTFDWLASEGNPEKLTAARTKIVNAIVGMALLAASVAIVYLLNSLGIFGFDILQLEWPKP